MTTATQAPEIVLMDLETAGGHRGCLIGNKGYWLKDMVDYVQVSAEDGSALYVVRLGARSKPCSCNCADRKWQPNRPGGCKHMKAVAELMRGW